MFKLCVLTDPDTATGFKLAGVDTYVASDISEAKKILNTLINDDKSGIIAVNEQFLGAIDERTRQKIDTLYRPIVVPLPVKEKVLLPEERRTYLSHLIRRAVGFDLTLRRK